MLKHMKKFQVACPICSYVSPRRKPISLESSQCPMWLHIRGEHFECGADMHDVWDRDGNGQCGVRCACGWESWTVHKGLLLLVTLIYDHWCWLGKRELEDHRIMHALGAIPVILAEKDRPKCSLAEEAIKEHQHAV
jgi:hypothetical protein